MDTPQLRCILLGLIGTASVPPLDALGEADWLELDRIAAMHRLQPLLHARHHGHPALPAPIATHWRTAHRTAALTAMAQRADLVRTARLLEAAGHVPIALKGAWLSRYAYPDPAQRPMRDLDLLVPREVVTQAYQTLLDDGYTQLEPAEMALGDIVRLEKHMPPLASPGGSVIELHHRLWEPDGRLDHATPQADDAAIHARAIVADEGLRFLAPADLLAHLIVHAVYSHRLDCGPLLLPDIALLLRAAPADWPAFWQTARVQGWRDGARLVLELVSRCFPKAVIDFAQDTGEPPPAALIEAAPDLLLQDLGSRASAHVAAATLKEGGRALAARAMGMRGASGETPAIRETAHEGGRLSWAMSRSWRTLRDLSRGDTRRQARHLAALSSWLDR